MRWLSPLLVMLAVTLVAQAQAPVVLEPPSRKACVPNVGTRTVTRTQYSVKCVDICLPFCDAIGLCQKDCAAGECGKVREVRRLMKRVVKEDVAEVKCVPADCIPHGHQHSK